MADTTQLTIQLNAKDEASKKIQDAGKKITETVKGIGEAAKKISVVSTAALAGIAGFAVKSVKDFSGVAEQLDNMHKSTGVAVQSLSALKYAADQTSVPLETMTTGIKKLQLSQNDLKGFKKNLDDIGLTSREILNIPIEEQFFKIGNAISKLPDPTDRTIASMQFFGKTGTDLLPIFGEGATTLEEWTSKAKNMGLILDTKTIDSALRADQAFDDFDATIKGVVNTASIQFLPIVTDMVEGLQPMIKAVGDWAAANPELVKQIAEWTVKILLAGAALGPLVKSVEAFGAVIKISKEIGEVSAALKVLTGIGLGPWGLALAGIVVSLTFIMENGGTISSAIEAIAEKLGLADTSAKNYAMSMKNVNGIVGQVSSLKPEVLDSYAKSFGGKPLTGLPLGSSIMAGTVSATLGQGSGKTYVPDSQPFAGITNWWNGFAEGGRPPRGVPSIVGENGPEMFLPDQSGTIIPNSRMGGGTTVNITVTGNTLLDDNAATKIGDMIFKQLRYQIKI